MLERKFLPLLIVIFILSFAGCNQDKIILGPLPGMEFVRIPEGSFIMGSPSDEKGHESYNEKQHQVSISSFQMMTTEVTQAMWETVMNNNPSEFQGENRPVENVSWDDCQAFITWLNQRYPGIGYRLPSDAEWEYACRAGTTTTFNTGDTLSTDQANYNGVDNARTSTVQATISLIYISLRKYQQNYGRYPSSIEELQELKLLYIDKFIKSQWVFLFIGSDPVTQIKGTSTIEMYDGPDHVVLFDVQTALFIGDDETNSGSRGIFCKQTTPVGSFSPNAWGLFDMHGNVQEWCHDSSGGYDDRS